MDLRDLPSIDSLASTMSSAFDRIPRPVVVAVCREALDHARVEIASGAGADPGADARSRLADIDAARPRTVINATGVAICMDASRWFAEIVK